MGTSFAAKRNKCNSIKENLFLVFVRIYDIIALRYNILLFIMFNIAILFAIYIANEYVLVREYNTCQNFYHCLDRATI